MVFADSDEAVPPPPPPPQLDRRITIERTRSDRTINRNLYLPIDNLLLKLISGISILSDHLKPMVFDRVRYAPYGAPGALIPAVRNSRTYDQ